MFLDKATGEIATVTAFIQVLLESETATELCRKIVHNGNGGSQLLGCEILRIEPSSIFSSIGSYGVRVSGLDCSVWSDCLAGEAVRSSSVVVKPFEGEIAEPQGALRPKSMFAIPLEHSSTPWGVLVLTASEKVEQNPLEPDTLQAISQLGAYFLKQNGFSGSGSVGSQGGSEELTNRQLVILEFMAQGLTNAQIAQELMLSESSIRQETVKIYRSLGVNNREAAAKQAKGLGLITPPPDHDPGLRTLATAGQMGSFVGSSALSGVGFGAPDQLPVNIDSHSVLAWL
jgi:DNA-binding CsgD family transcriptional regulator